MYVDERLTAHQIARRLGCTGTTVLRRLRRLGIAVRARGPLVDDRGDWPVWTPELAYVVGLIATDGNLSPDGRHLAIPSGDRSLLESIRACLGLTNRIREECPVSRPIYRLQWGDRVFYDWLLSIGMTPAKSLTLQALAVPDEQFPDFFRGCIDGDGSVLRYTDRYHTRKNESYVYERLYVVLVSASRPFLEWVQGSIIRLVGARGAISINRKPAARPLYALRYGKRESIPVLRWCYYAPGLPCLARKRARAAPFLSV
jgi:hypothetical protein